MERLIERFATFMASNVVLIYLFSMFLSTATYFVGHLVGNDSSIAVYVGFGLAFAAETHSFLSQRLMRSKFQAMGKLDETLPEYEVAEREFRIHTAITSGLVAFSIFNAIAFWAMIEHPVSIGDWLSVVVRGTVIPLAFLAAGFLVPLEYDANRILSDASHKMLKRTVKVTARQWHRRIKRAQEAGINLAPITAALMEDANDKRGARRIRLIDESLSRVERTLPSVSQRQHPLPIPTTVVEPVRLDRSPTGPGTPSAASASRTRSKPITLSGSGMAPIRLKIGRPRKDRRTAYMRIAHYLADHPSASVREIERGAKVSSSTASKYRDKILAEMAKQQQVAR